jgi:hypothetical protein
VSKKRVAVSLVLSVVFCASERVTEDVSAQQLLLSLDWGVGWTPCDFYTQVVSFFLRTLDTDGCLCAACSPLVPHLGWLIERADFLVVWESEHCKPFDSIEGILTRLLDVQFGAAGGCNGALHATMRWC